MKSTEFYHPGHATKWTKGNEAKGIKPKPILPTAHETAILRRTALGFFMVTFIDGEPHYTYEDGTEVRITPRAVEKMVRQGWLIPDKSTNLFRDSGEPQVYRARKAR